MEANLKFDLPEDQDQLQAAIDAMKWRGLVNSIDNELRRLLKYENQKTADIEKLRKFIYDEMRADGVSLP